MTDPVALPSAATDVEVKTDIDIEQRVWRKVTLRLIPFMFILYVVAYLDRINVSFAQMQMREELGFTERIYGWGAGIFFIGYFLFEVPSNLLMVRVGARAWIARIMITWGIISAGMMFMRSPMSFYVLRFLLGIAEAGFFPGMILYLTYWYPLPQRARAVAYFMTATSVSGMVGGPISGALLQMHGLAGLSGWQWLFLLEGVPAVVLGVVVYFYLDDRPDQAAWLTPAERSWLLACVQADERKRAHHHSLLQMLTDPRVLLMSLLYFSLVIGFYGLTLWLPPIIKEFGDLSYFQVGLLSAIPNLLAVIAMVLSGNHSDRTGERRWHIAVAATIGAVGLTASAFSGSPVLSLCMLSVAAMGMRSTLGPFWALSTSFLGGTAAAGGIAMINSLGNLGGHFGPDAIGRVKAATGSFQGGLLILAGMLIVAAVLALSVRPRPMGENGDHA